jgi:uncharacterized YccA/Bax inhibitor family protein
MIEIANTSNPIFRRFPAPCTASGTTEQDAPRMSFNGAIRKTAILTLWTGICAVWIWNALSETRAPVPQYQETLFLILLAVSGVLPFVLVALSIWRKTLSPFLAPIYSMLQGVFLGFIAFAAESRFNGIAMQAFCLSFVLCIVYAAAYRFEYLRPSDKFNRKILFALLAAAVYFALAMALPFIGIRIFPAVLYGTGLAFSGLIVIVGGITFISTYDLACKSAQQNYPEYMEWHAAFGLIISMVWLYLEGLRVFIKDRVPNEAAQI